MCMKSISRYFANDLAVNYPFWQVRYYYYYYIITIIVVLFAGFSDTRGWISLSTIKVYLKPILCLTWCLSSFLSGKFKVPTSGCPNTSKYAAQWAQHGHLWTCSMKSTDCSTCRKWHYKYNWWTDSPCIFKLRIYHITQDSAWIQYFVNFIIWLTNNWHVAK